MDNAAVPSSRRLEAPSRAVASPAVWIVAGLGLLGLALRVLAALRSGIWRDEGLFLFIVRLPSLGQMWEFLSLRESHPPLFYLLMRGWLALFGDTEAAALALPVLLGVLLIPAAYFVASDMFSPRAGLVAAALAATSPLLSRHAALVRPYSLLPLLSLLSVYLLWRGLKTGAFRAWAGYVAATLLMLFTHNWAWLVLGAQWTVTAGAAFLPLRRPLIRNPRAVLRPWLLSQLAVLAFYAPWLPTFVYQARHAGHDPGPALSPRALLDVLFMLSTFTVGIPAMAAVAVLLVLASVLAFRRITAARPGRAVVASDAVAGDAASAHPALAPALLIGIPLVASVAALVLSPRSNLLLGHCFTAIAVHGLVALAAGIAALSPPRRARPVLPVLVTVALVALHLGASYVLLDRVKSNARDVARAIRAQARPADLILVTPEYMGSSFNYYFDAANPQINFPQIGRSGLTPMVDARDRMADPEAFLRVKRRLAEARATGQRVWLVMEGYQVSDGLTDDLHLPAAQYTHYAEVGRIRSNQLRGYLAQLYGPPDETAIPPDPRIGQEILRAFLFTPRQTTRR